MLAADQTLRGPDKKQIQAFPRLPPTRTEVVEMNTFLMVLFWAGATAGAIGALYAAGGFGFLAFAFLVVALLR